MGALHADEGEGLASKFPLPSLINSIHPRTLTCFQAKPTHQNIIRLAPPLVITEDEIQKALAIIQSAISELPGLQGPAEDSVIPPPEKKVKIGLEN